MHGQNHIEYEYKR